MREQPSSELPDQTLALDNQKIHCWLNKQRKIERSSLMPYITIPLTTLNSAERLAKGASKKNMTF